MAAGLSYIIENLDLAALVELVNQGYELEPEGKPRVLQHFENEFFGTTVEDTIDPSRFSEEFNQKLDILFRIYQQDPEVLQQLSLLRPQRVSLDLDSIMSEEALLAQAIALSLADSTLLPGIRSDDVVPVSAIPVFPSVPATTRLESVGSPSRRYTFIGYIPVINPAASISGSSDTISPDRTKNSPSSPQ